MELGDEEDFESNKSQKKEIRKEIEDTAIDKLIDGVEVLHISGGMATIAVPLELLKIFKMFSKLLDITQEQGMTR